MPQSATPPVPEIRLTPLNQNPPYVEGEYVIYWMIAQRRLHWNFGLQRALWWCEQLKRPLLIFEPLRVGYKWASRRHHQFIIDGMIENSARCAQLDVCYFPYVEGEEGESAGLLKTLSERACVVVTDEYPCFFLPRMLRAAAARLPRRLEQVDSNGLLPLRASGRSFTTAASFRRHLQKTLLPYFETEHFPHPDPLALCPMATGARIPREVSVRWPIAALDRAETSNGDEAMYRRIDLSRLPIDQGVRPAERGGRASGLLKLHDFLERRLSRYHSDRNVVEGCAASGLSAHLHFGHVSAHEIAEAAFRACAWSPAEVAPKPTGSRAGWWGASPGVESFIDELVTWRELGFAFSFHHPETYDDYESLPAWALKTLSDHEGDPRPHLYTLEALDRAETHDPIWSAAQRQLRREGRIHNYLRMLWGKKILEWSPTPREALARLIHLNNRYALDGRDPNSYSGIFWCMGRFDRAWGPERPIFGKVRFMTSESTRRKIKLTRYLERFGAEGELEAGEPIIDDLFSQ